MFDHDLFLLSWGPTVAALSYVFDNAEDKGIVEKAITGFRCVGVWVCGWVGCGGVFAGLAEDIIAYIIIALSDTGSTQWLRV